MNCWEDAVAKVIELIKEDPYFSGEVLFQEGDPFGALEELELNTSISKCETIIELIDNLLSYAGTFAYEVDECKYLFFVNSWQFGTNVIIYINGEAETFENLTIDDRNTLRRYVIKMIELAMKSESVEEFTSRYFGEHFY